ncbi:MAG: DUF2007 domain-containing protein [Dehalococcoidia bacterium]|nr:DUF2007 domain-containing protein [Dehalococcoidia bacterium]
MNEKLVSVYTARGEMEAQIILGLLETGGIRSLLQSSAARSVHALMDGVGEIKIMVAASDAEEARKIIEAKADV